MLIEQLSTIELIGLSLAIGCFCLIGLGLWKVLDNHKHCKQGH